MNRARRVFGVFGSIAIVGAFGAGCGSQANAPENVTETAEALGSANIVISQVYGGGGNSGSKYENDFVELFNRGTSAVSVAGWSVQYTSASGSSWSVTNLSGTIQPGHYYLVQEAAGSGGTTALPPPDAAGTTAMSLSTGKVALVNNQTALTCSSSCLPNTHVVDFVGYGSSADSFEGSGPTPTLTNTTAAVRAGAGCTDTDNNASDFTATTVNPRNSSSPTTNCGGGGQDAGGSGGQDSGSGGQDSGSGGQDSGSAGTDSGTLPTLPSPTLPPVQMNNLVFGAFGDIRPANPDDTTGYPTNIISAIFAGLQSKGIAFAVDGGDHCFQSATTSGGPCHAQFGLFMNAKNANYSGTLIPTLGNHESCGTDAATTGNCTTWTSGLIHDFLVDIVQPTTGQSSFPYYSVLVHGPWGTAKFVHVAANAWTSAQNTWLANTLNVPTTYTFGVRHEPFNDTRAPGVTPSESLYSSHFNAGTLTLSITGHTHLVQLPGGTQPYGDSFGATQAYETILGNAGAPLDAGPYYGFAVMQRRVSDGAIVTQAYESIASDGSTSLNNVADTNFRFAVNPNGTPNSNTSLP